MEGEKRSFARLWTLELPEDGDNEFHWNPELAEQQLQDQHVVQLIEGLDSRCRSLTVGADNLSDAKKLLLTCARASGAPVCSTQELDCTALNLARHVVAQKLGPTLCGYPVSVTVEGTSLVLALQRFSGPLDDTFLSDLQASVDAFFVREASALVTLDLATNRRSFWRRRRNELDESHANEGMSNWRHLLEGSRDLELDDGLTEQEKCLGGQLAAKSLREARIVASEDEESSSCLMAPLGVLGDNSNPILAAMVTAGTALIAESLAGGGHIQGYAMRSVELRGCRGCAVKFSWQQTCAIS